MTPKPTESHDDLVRRRQQARARVMALLLDGFVILTFLIAIVKIKAGHG